MREEAERLRAVMESAPNAVVIVDDRGKIIVTNSEAERMFGYGRDELIDETIEMLIPKAARRRHSRQRERFVTQQSTRPMGIGRELTALRKDGTEFPVEIGLGRLQTDHGVLITSAITDITARKQAESALAEAEERFRGAFEGAPIGMALLDARGRLTKVNQALCELTGRTAAGLEGSDCAELTHPDDAAGLREGLHAIGTGERTLYASERRLTHACGKPVWTALQATLIHSGNGAPRRFLMQVQDITDRKRYEQRLRSMADHDALTGLLNRRSFNRELDSQAALATRYGAEGALLMLDLDHFKFINDTLGHQAGDELILHAAQLLAGRLRATDKIARLGGDEFAILLPKADAVAAERVALDLIEVLTRRPLAVGMTTRTITASIGIAMFEPELSGQDVLVNADLAMYDAKESGRGCFSSFKPSLHEQMKETARPTRLGWLERIRAALDEQRFRLYAQPIVDYKTGLITRHELHPRMIDEQGELIAPETFLYIAERLDVVRELDAWVIRNAVQLLARSGEGRSGDGRSAVGKGATPVHVNLSGRSLSDPRLLELIEQELADSGVAAPRLTLEITETAAVNHITHAQRFSERLAELGCQVALDDFGAGFGSFYYLKRLNFDLLKIDAGLVRNCSRSKTERLVIEAVVGIAGGLGKSTVADGVEDGDTVDVLRQLGVDFGQGYHHGRPSAAELRLVAPAR